MRGQPRGPEALAELSPTVPGDLGDYRLLTRVARGGMAEVYLAERIASPDEGFLAVKVLLPRLAQRRKFVDMFTAEGKLGLMLDHVNIVKTLDVGSMGRIRYIAMEYIQGQDLGRIVRVFRNAGAPVLVPIALLVVRESLAGLAYAHELEDASGAPLQMVNRDFSPANVMVGFDGKVRLIDFGIAQALLDYRSQIGSIKGKVTYMSPEQVRGLALDARSDLFSVGTVLYQLLTMTEPFQGPSEFEQMERVREANPPPVHEVNPRIDRPLSDIVAKAMAKEPVRRFVDAREMLEAIESYCDSASIDLDNGQLSHFMKTEFASVRSKQLNDVAEARRVLEKGFEEVEDDDTTTPTDSAEVRAVVEEIGLQKKNDEATAKPKGPQNPPWMLPVLIGMITVAVILTLIIVLRG